MSADKKPLLEVKHLKKYFHVGKNQTLKAVRDISLDIYKGETLGLVGESGCGKSTFGRTVIQLYEPTEGTVVYDGQVINNSLSQADFHTFTRKMQMIFQDPYASLNPRMKVMDIIAEGMDAHGIFKGQERRKKVIELLETVGLSEEHANRFPHEFSGGQRQRIGIARALALNPKLIIADEPVSALDLSVQAQVLNFMKDIQKRFKLSYLFISHDLGVVEHMCTTIAIMHKGRFVEAGVKEEIYKNPMHIYTKKLIAAIPDIDPGKREESQRFRQQVAEEYSLKYREYYNEKDQVYDMKRISDNHIVALP